MSVSPVLSGPASQSRPRSGRKALRGLPLAAAAALALALSGCIIIPIPVGIPLSTFSSGPITGAAFRQPPPGPSGDLVREVNKFRAAHGLHALSWNDRLAAAAMSHARDLDLSGTFGHVGSKGSTLMGRTGGAGYRHCYISENAGRGQGSAARMVSGWAGSPGHRRAMLSPKASEAGGAMSNVRGRPLWVINFGSGCL